jgi:hypothetical protein
MDLGEKEQGLQVPLSSHHINMTSLLMLTWHPSGSSTGNYFLCFSALFRAELFVRSHCAELILTGYGAVVQSSNKNHLEFSALFMLVTAVWVLRLLHVPSIDCLLFLLGISVFSIHLQNVHAYFLEHIYNGCF